MFIKIKKPALVALLCVSLIPNLSFAENNKIDSGIEKSKIESIMSIDDMKREYNPEEAESIGFYSLNRMSNNSVSDNYEPNNTYETAKDLGYASIVNANIDNANDVDWYKFTVDDFQMNKCIAGQYAVILRNPYGRDYKLNLLKQQADGNYARYEVRGTLGYQTVFFDLEKGNYAICIAPNKNIPNNYGSENYQIYVGNTFVERYTGYRETNVKVDFGNKLYNPRYLSDPQYYDLTNDSSIPDLSYITAVNVSSDGNGAYWIGLVKIFDGIEASPGLDYIPVEEHEAIPVKANHSIQAYMTNSKGFIWQPKVSIDYIYPLIEENARFYFGR